jgi:hypothetical protein
VSYYSLVEAWPIIVLRAALEALAVFKRPLPEIIDTIDDLEAEGVRNYISEPDRGRRIWKKQSEARDAVYRNRWRIRGARGQRLLRRVVVRPTRSPLCASERWDASEDAVSWRPSCWPG